MRIYESDGGNVFATAISKLSDGTDVDGHRYTMSNGAGMQILFFQQGTVPEVGHNGCTNEQLIAVLVHRLKFLNGKFPCRENALAITKLEEALMWLEKRTADRKARGVEGKHER